MAAVEHVKVQVVSTSPLRVSFTGTGPGVLALNLWSETYANGDIVNALTTGSSQPILLPKGS